MELRTRATAVACLTTLSALSAAPALADTGAPSALSHIQLADDPLEPSIVLSTERVNPARRSLIGLRSSDGHLRAIVDRRNGAVRYELRQTLQYMGNFRDFQQANYQAPDGVATASLKRLEENRAHCDGLDPQAACFEVVSFEVPEAQLRGLAAGGETWSFKFKPRLGAEHRADMPVSEIQALLSAVDSYKARRPVAVASQGQP